MTTTPTRQDVLDALLAERIEAGWKRAPARQTFKEFAALIVEAELEAMDGGGDYDTVYASLIRRHRRGLAVLNTWRLVQSNSCSGCKPDEANAALLACRALGAVGSLVEVCCGYVPTHDHMRYVGLAPRQQEES